jgi:hypothetical protein
MAASLYTQAVTTIHAALYGNQPANPVFVTETNAASMGVRAYVNSKVASVANGGSSDALLATTVLDNMGINNAALNDALVSYFAAAPADRGYVILQLSQILTAIADPAHPQHATYGAAADAWNSSQAAAYIYSSNPLNVVPAPSSELPDVPVTSGTVFTASSDDIPGSSLDDLFNAPLSQNDFAGGVSNTLSSADKLHGGAGTDTLKAELVPEFYGATGNNQIDVQPRTTSVEHVEFEAREFGSNDTLTKVISVDAKWMKDIEKIGSFYSDADLIIENLTTLTGADAARDTEAITITMDHTDNFNSDHDASDLTVYFDEDYLLAGRNENSQLEIRLVNSFELATNDTPLVAFVSVNFKVEGTLVEVPITAAIRALKGAAAYDALVDAIKAQLVTQGLTGLTVAAQPLRDAIFTDDVGSFPQGAVAGNYTPIKISTSDATKTLAKGTATLDNTTLDFNGLNTQVDQFTSGVLPVTVNIELHKVGREGEGGDLIIGGKELDSHTPAGAGTTSQNEGKGITVFKVSVLGDSSKPSNLGTLDSTNGDLETITIKTDAAFASGPTFASLTVRDGFGNAGVVIPGQVNQDNDLKLVDATAFKGDLTLGEDTRVLNLDTLTATGGGKVMFYALLNGAEEYQPYSYTTGAADDTVDVLVRGDALDFATSPKGELPGASLKVVTGAGKDAVTITTAMTDPQGNQLLNEVVLRNIAVDTGDGDDTVTFGVGTEGNVIINTGAGNDVVDTSAGAGRAIWAFNYDDTRTDVTSLATTPTDNLPGVQTSWAFLNNATVRVTLSGAGVAAVAAGGGVMALGDANQFVNGYESATNDGIISTLVSGNKYFGDQRDINLAIIKAITTSATLSKLLDVKVSTNNTLVITSKTGGAFNTGDLEITLVQAKATNQTYADDVVRVAKDVFHNSLLTTADLWGNSTPAAGANYVGAAKGAGAIDTINGQAGLTAYYTGLGVNNATLHTGAAASIFETDTTINGGDGNDVLVLSTDAVGGGVPAYSSPTAVGLTADLDIHNRLLNGASNETIKMSGSFGNDVVMNFTSSPLAAGVDFLDYTTYLTSKMSPSGSAASTVDIPVTLGFDATDVLANEVSVVRFDNTDEAAETFSNLAGADIAKLFNLDAATTLIGTNNLFGNLTAASFSVKGDYDDSSTDGTAAVDLVNGKAKAVVMVENADNLGQYKVFELDWNGGKSSATHTVAATLIGELDFGTSLSADMTTVSLIGSTANKLLSLNGGVVVTPTYAVAATATNFNEGTDATFTVTTTDVANGTVLAYTLGGVNAADITGGALAGNVTITNNTGTITVPLAADLTTGEGAETLIATVAGVSASTTVNDTSVAAGTGRTEVALTSGTVVTNAATGAFEYNIVLGATDIIAATVGQFGEDDAFDVDNAFINPANLFFATTGANQINMAVGDLTDFTPTMTVNINVDDADLVTAVAGAADSAAIIGVLEAAWGTDWLV